MVIKKIILYFSIFSIPFMSCKKTIQSELANQSVAKSEQENPKIIEKDLTIYNSGSNFGEIAITGKATRLYFVKNTAKGDISFKSIKLDNNTFSFKDGFPGYKDIGAIKSPKLCAENSTLLINESCRFAVTFTPNSEKEELVNLTFKYNISGIKKNLDHPLSGKGRKLSAGAIKFLQLENDFVQVPIPALTDAEKESLTKDANLVASVFAEGHSNKFYLDDFFKSQANQASEVWKKHLDLSRVIGYTFRADDRAPRVPGINCDEYWKNGFKLTQESTGNIISYPPHKDDKGNIEDCGIKDVGGFWPSVTRPSDMVYIDKMLVNYKKQHGHDILLKKLVSSKNLE